MDASASFYTTLPAAYISCSSCRGAEKSEVSEQQKSEKSEKQKVETMSPHVQECSYNLFQEDSPLLKQGSVSPEGSPRSIAMNLSPSSVGTGGVLQKIGSLQAVVHAVAECGSNEQVAGMGMLLDKLLDAARGMMMLPHKTLASSSSSNEGRTPPKASMKVEEWMVDCKTIEASAVAKSEDEPDESDEEVIEVGTMEILAEHTHFCEICGKGFKRDANLRMHMRGHGDEYKSPSALARPLKTMLCVKNHYRRSHCPKLLTCGRCRVKRFAVLADLKTHEKHCGSERWQCSCGTTFSRKDKLLGHVALFLGGHTPIFLASQTSPAGVGDADACAAPSPPILVTASSSQNAASPLFGFYRSTCSSGDNATQLQELHQQGQLQELQHQQGQLQELQQHHLYQQAQSEISHQQNQCDDTPQYVFSSLSSGSGCNEVTQDHDSSGGILNDSCSWLFEQHQQQEDSFDFLGLDFLDCKS